MPSVGWLADTWSALTDHVSPVWQACSDFVARWWGEFAGLSPLQKTLAIATLAGLIGVPSAVAFFRRRPPPSPPGPPTGPTPDSGGDPLVQRALGQYATKLEDDLARRDEELRAAKAALDALARERKDATGERAERLAEAQALAAEGDFAKAEAIFEEIARAHEEAGRADLKSAAAALKHKAALALGRSVEAALHAYARAAELDPDDGEAAYWVGQINIDMGRTAAAAAAFEALAARGNRVSEPRWLAWGLFGLGDVLMAQGNLEAAGADYRRAQELIEAALKADPSNAGWQHDLSVSHE
ncbi:MAG: tetratricopeptide repeat protein, partial [Hyphomicrobiaceae bacterium]